MPRTRLRLPAVAISLAATFSLGAVLAYAADALVVDRDVVTVTTGLAVQGTATATSFEGMGAMPKGAILMWSGSTDQLPEGWVLCDGQVLPGGRQAPDLRGRFIVGFDPGRPEYSVGKTGGEEQTRLTVEQMPAHSHAASADPAGEHTHDLQVSMHGWAYHNWVASGDPSKKPAVKTHLPAAGLHTHNIKISPSGGNQPFENRPPYYALAYIMYVGG